MIPVIVMRANQRDLFKVYLLSLCVQMEYLTNRSGLVVRYLRSAFPPIVCLTVRLVRRDKLSGSHISDKLFDIGKGRRWIV